MKRLRAFPGSPVASSRRPRSSSWRCSSPDAGRPIRPGKSRSPAASTKKPADGPSSRSPARPTRTVISTLSPGRRSGTTGSPSTPPALSRLFDDFCDEKILLSQARASGVVLSDEERSDYLEKLRVAMGADSASGLPAADESVLSDRLLTEKYLSRRTKDIAVEDGEVAAYYEAHKSDFLQPEKVQVSQILLDSEGKASTIRERLRGATEEDFRAVARRESAGPGGRQGRDHGRLQPRPASARSSNRSSFPCARARSAASSDRRTASTSSVSTSGRNRGSSPSPTPRPAIRARLLDEKGRRAVADHLDELKRTLEWRAFPDRLAVRLSKERSTMKTNDPLDPGPPGLLRGARRRPAGGRRDRGRRQRRRHHDVPGPARVRDPAPGHPGGQPPRARSSRRPWNSSGRRSWTR